MNLLSTILSVVPSASVASQLAPLYSIAQPLVLAATALAITEEFFEFIIHADPAHVRNAALQAAGGLLAYHAITIFQAVIGTGFQNPFA